MLLALRGAFRAVHERTSGVLERYGLHFGQHYLLEELWREEGQAVGRLAERLGVEGPTAVRTVRRMEAAGFVHREPDPTDRRRVLVFLTERGRELEAVLPRQLGEIARQAVEGLPEAEVRALAHALRTVQSNLR